MMIRHAYLIMAHQNVTQLYRLLQFLDLPENGIFLHVDKKEKQFDVKKAKKLCARADIRFMPRKYLAWGGNSLVKCEISLLKAALPGNYDYYHLISGEDIPLCSHDEISTFFTENMGKEFVSVDWEATNKPNSGIYNRIRYYNWFQNYVGRGDKGLKRFVWELQLILKNLQKKCNVDRCKKMPFRLAKGSQWFSITHDFAKYIVECYETQYKRLFTFSFGTDELLVQTALINHAFFASKQYEEGNMRLIDWARSENGCSPYTFTAADYKYIMQSEKLWARKVSEKVDRQIIDMIYAEIRQK